MKDLEYIAYKSVLAIKNVLDTTHQFIEPEAVKGIMSMYKVENSSILSWVQAKKVTIAHMKAVKFDELYAEYTLWCELNGFKSVRSTRFEQEIQEEFNLIVDGDTLIDK